MSSTRTKTIIAAIIVAFILTVIYTNLSYWLSDVTWIVPGVIAWNWNDFMVMVLVSTGITSSMAVLMHNLLVKTKKRRKRSD
jgi:hypothetical protein